MRDLDICLSDNCQAWKLTADGYYERIRADGAKPVNAQSELISIYAAGPVAAV